MILSKINYCENKDKNNYWEIRNVMLGHENLIIGLNATGKTRLMRIIHFLSRLLSKKIKVNHGSNRWHVEFKELTVPKSYEYELEICEGEIVFEELKEDEVIRLERKHGNGTIYSYTKEKMVLFSPPRDELTVNVRRDIDEHPFLEDLVKWSRDFLIHSFIGVSPLDIIIQPRTEESFYNLEQIPSLLYELISKNKKVKAYIVKAFSSIGYPINSISAEKRQIPGTNVEFIVSSVRERGLQCSTEQGSMSQGMYRALSLIVIIQHLLSLNKECTLIIDDLGEGLDFERSSKITKWLFKTINGSKIQLIATSNDRFMINSANLECINLLIRDGHVVESLNYHNNKDKFEEFRFTGLNNFDMLSGNI